MTLPARLAIALVWIAAGTNLPVPLLLLYQDRLDMSATSTVGLFGIYAAGLVPAVCAAGPVADRWGHRPVVTAACLLSALVSVTFATVGSSELMLFAARCAQGMAAGAVFTVVSVWLQEIDPARSGRGSWLAAVSMTGGFAGGSLLGGLWGQWWSDPLATPFLLHAAGCLLAAVLVLGVGASKPGVSVTTRSGALFAFGMRRRALLVVAPPAMFVFGFPATAISAVPVLVGLPTFPVAATGVLAAVTLGTSALVAPLQRRWGESTVPRAGLAGAVGMTLAAWAAADSAAGWALVPAVVALGAGGGLALSGGLARLPAVAAPGRSATVAAGFYSIAYLGFAVPVIISLLGAVLPVWTCLATLAVLCLVVVAAQPRRGDL